MTHMIPWEYFMKKMFFVERGVGYTTGRENDMGGNFLERVYNPARHWAPLCEIKKVKLEINY